jgi:ribosome-binding protein aMBF1 (putative translation factor)
VRRKGKSVSASTILRRRYYEGAGKQRFAEAEAVGADLALGDKIRSLREEAGLTQAQLAAQVDTQPSQISRIEDADYDGHSVATLRRIATALHAKLRIEFVTEAAPPMKRRKPA